MAAHQKSILTALAIFLLLVLWMASGSWGDDSGSVQATTEGGELTGGPESLEQVAAEEGKSAAGMVSVVIETSHARWVQPEMEIYSRSEPLQAAGISSPLAGIVESVSMQPGQLVKQGEVIAQLSMGTKLERLSEAKAWVKKRTADLAAATTMKSKGYQSEAEYQGIAAALETAKREQAQVELEIRLGTIRASFDGVIEKRSVEPGDVVSIGQVLGQLVRQNQYLLVANVPESQVHLFATGQLAKARLATGSMVTGRVRYIATQADSQTRSYRLEVVVDNPQERFVGGATAKLLLKRDKIQVHQVSSNVVTLDDTGVLGVKTVNAENIVEFWPIDISQAERQTLLVEGMPKSTQVIVSGQGFVRAGDAVLIADANSSVGGPDAL